MGLEMYNQLTHCNLLPRFRQSFFQISRSMGLALTWLASMLLLDGCQDKIDNPVADIKKESELVSLMDSATLNKNNSETIETLEKLVRFYPNSKKHRAYFIQLIETQFATGEYQQAKDRASDYMARFSMDDNADKIGFLWLKSIGKLTKSSWLGARVYKPGDLVSQELLEEGIAVAEQMLTLPKNRYTKEAKQFQRQFTRKLASRHYDIALFYARKKAYLASQQRLKQCLDVAIDPKMKQQAKDLWQSNADAISLT